MFNYDHARNDLNVALTDARHWADRSHGNPERAEIWHRLVLIYSLAIDTLDAVLDRHNGITCHPDADCDHEEPSFGYVLAEIPDTANRLTFLRTGNTDEALLVAEKLLFVIGSTAELDRWAEQNA